MVMTVALPCCCVRMAASIFFLNFAFGESSVLYDRSRPSLRVPYKRVLDPSPASCLVLTNRGSHSTVDIEVGTPGQLFSVVADTGSDDVIIPSCVCQETKHCSDEIRCFRGTGRSSTFSVLSNEQGPLGTVVTFGSGPVAAIVASDVVKVGSISAKMENGVFLMVDQNLNIPSGAFEGILGLGVPRSKTAPLPPTTTPEPRIASIDTIIPGSIGEIVQQILGNVQDPPHARSVVQLPGSRKMLKHELGQTDDPAVDEVFTNPGFLEMAGVSRFSVCFNEDSDGTLRMNPQPAAKILSNVGRQHWALDFRGVSVGGASSRLSFCGAEGMQDGQETPCAAVPDSGSTMIMAPKAHVNMLFDSLCDRWQRCSGNYTSSLNTYSKSRLFRLLLFDCGSWLDSVHGLDELPPLKFHVAGADGTEQVLEMTGWSYVIEAATRIPGAQGGKRCKPAIDPFEMHTELNGPVWIFGTAFFYMFDVGYDLEASPPGISFTPVAESPCGTCGPDGTVSLVSSDRHENVTAFAKHFARPPRRVNGQRMPNIDITGPL